MHKLFNLIPNSLDSSQTLLVGCDWVGRKKFKDSSEILIKSLAIFSDPDRVEELTAREPVIAEGIVVENGAAVATGGENDILIDELELSVRSYNCLKRAGIETIGQLLVKSESELAAIPNFGSKSIEEVIENLEGRGHHLRQD